MSGKVKMRCGRCGKPFKSANAKQIFCPDCEQKERAVRAASKANSAKPVAAAVPAAKPKIVGAGAHILDPNAALPHPPTSEPQSGAAGVATRHSATSPTPRPAPAVAPPNAPGHGERHGHGQKPHGPRPAVRAAHQPPAPKAPKTPKEQTKPFQLTDEQRSAIESRYLELAQPVEYDGIRSQIAAEIGVPKAPVKRAVYELRQRMQMPSWWELQAYQGTPDDLERIRAAYMPHLPIPDVGVHRRIAEELGLEAPVVYQGIRRIRAELRLPQYNPPELHGTPVATSGAAPDETADVAATGGSASAAASAGTVETAPAAAPALATSEAASPGESH